MAKVPTGGKGGYRSKRPVRAGKTRQDSVAGEGTSIYSLPTKQLKERDAEAKRLDTSQRDIGGSGNLIYDSRPIWFISNPRVITASATGIDVSAVVGVGSAFQPQDSDNYFGIWAQPADLTDAQVKAGTGAIEHETRLDVPHSLRIDHTFTSDLQVGTTYELHWLAEHPESGESVRAPTVVFTYVNSRPAGLPYITGTTTVGQALTCHTDAITDPDGLTTPGWTYQWLRAGVTIAGAVNVTYTLQEADKYKLISCRVGFTDDGGTLEMLTSAQVGPIAATNYTATGQPSITGTMVEGNIILAGWGTIADQNGLPQSPDTIQWQWDGFEAIPGATGWQYTLGADDVDRTLQLGVAFTDLDGFSEGPLWSDETAMVKAFNRVAKGKPGIDGTVLEGETLTCTEGNITDDNGVPAINTWTFQWNRATVPIAGATNQTYTLQAADIGSQMTVTVYFTDDDGYNEGPLTSDPTIFVPEANIPATGAPGITGAVAEGSTLTATAGTVADANGVPPIGEWTWQWQRGTSDIPGETTQTYLIAPGDVGNTLRVSASFTDDAGYAEGPLWSADTIVVPGSNQPPTGIPAITGTVLEGETLTCDTSPISDADGIDQGSWTYQWQRDMVDVPGRMLQTYAIDGNDIGAKIRVYVYFDDLGGTNEGPLYSLETITVIRSNRDATGKPDIDNTTPNTHDLLTAGAGNIADANGLPAIGTWAWQWHLDGVDIVGETSQTYTVKATDYGLPITVSASFTDDDGYDEGPLTSDPTADVGVAEFFHDFTTADANGFPLTDHRDSDATVTDYQATTITVGADVPGYPGGRYADPDWFDEGVGYGLQLEESRTNHTYYSDDCSQWISNLNVDVTTDTVIGPLGKAVNRVTCNTANGDHYLQPSQINTDGSPESVVYVLHAGNHQWVQLLRTGTNPWVNIDLVNGVVGNGSGFNSVNVEPIGGDGFWKITAYRAGEVTSNVNHRIYLLAGDDNLATGNPWTPAGTEYILFSHQQFEYGAFPTSYIPVPSFTPITRAATDLQAPFSALDPLPAGGVVNDFCLQLIGVLGAGTADQAGKRLIELSNGTTTEALSVYIQDATTIAVDTVRGGAATTSTATIVDPGAGGVLDVRVRKALSTGLSISVNGAAFTTNGADTAPMSAQLTTSYIGQTSAKDDLVDIDAVHTRIVPAALSDQEITDWAGWTPPAPIITSQPEAIDFGGAPPVGAPTSLSLLFSDLIDGPRSGWSAAEPNKGAAVTVWGTGIGSTQGSNKLYVGGTEITDIVEWGVEGKPIPWLRHITFHLNSAIPTGDTTIQLEIGGELTETIPFHVRSTGAIYFIDSTQGTNGTGDHDDPWNTEAEYFKNSNPYAAVGDILYFRAGTYGQIFGFGTRCVAGAANNMCAVIGYPGEDAYINVIGGSDPCITDLKDYWAVSKFRCENDTNSVIKVQDALYNRVVGNDVTGRSSPSGTGLITAPGSSAAMVVLGNQIYGWTRDSQQDHAVYFGGDGGHGPNICAYNYIHSNQFSGGGAISVNYQDNRVSSGVYIRSHYIHHNLVDTRSPNPDSSAWCSEGINVWNHGDERDGNTVPQPGDPTYVFNNIVISDSQTPKGGMVGTSASYVQGPNAWDVRFYNNLAINFNERGAYLTGFATSGDTSEAAMILQGNMAITDNAASNYFVGSNDAPLATVTSSNNSFFGGSGSSLPPGDSGSIQTDPLLTYDLDMLTFALAHNSPAKGIASDPGILEQTRDYNFKAYGARFDAGALLAEDG